ncbi:MAG: cellulase family glycosylhydrolase [Clostridia bacterium]|nr:cellulase family glycosylhydrolase [Clostridia bacterium]
MNFLTGVNYWASEFGVKTFACFESEVIDKDFATLKEYGVDTIRVFPLLSDFMPVIRSHAKTNSFALRINGVPLEYHPYKSGLNESAVEDFKTLLSLAKKHGLKVIVALITGWMSGKSFLPPFFESKNPITDKECIVYECKFIKDFVSIFKSDSQIIAWELGNECNALSFETDRAENDLWLTTISQAIRVADSSRPVYAGMHGLTSNGNWSLESTGELLDMQTTHPYPLFTPYCSKEDVNSMRACLHASAESEYYSSVSNTPCLVEEIGTLGPMVCSGKSAGEYVEKAYATSIASNTAGFLWWCAFDQDKLDFPPYDTFAVEQNLGMFKSDRTPKETAVKLGEVKNFFNGLDKIYTKKDITVILTAEQDEWGVAYASYVLALQSGHYATFQYENQPLKDSDYYLLPSIKSLTGIPKLLQKQLKQKVENGATLLITYDGGYTPDFEDFCGLEVSGRQEKVDTLSFEIDGYKAEIERTVSLSLTPTTAETIDLSSDVILTKNKVKNGYVYFMNAPLENYYTNLSNPQDSNLYIVYKKVFENPLPLVSSNKKVAVFNGNGNAVIVNFSDENTIELLTDKKITKLLNATVNGNKITMNKSYAYVEYED